jgi:hypothetical protein
MDITSESIRPNLHLAATAAFKKLEKYYSETSDFYTIATVLDPKLKLEPCMNSMAMISVKLKIRILF